MNEMTPLQHLQRTLTNVKHDEVTLGDVTMTPDEARDLAGRLGVSARVAEMCWYAAGAPHPCPDKRGHEGPCTDTRLTRGDAPTTGRVE